MRTKSYGMARRESVYKQTFFISNIRRTPNNFEVAVVTCAACGYMIDTVQGGFRRDDFGKHTHRICPSLKERKAFRQAALES